HPQNARPVLPFTQPLSVIVASSAPWVGNVPTCRTEALGITTACSAPLVAASSNVAVMVYEPLLGTVVYHDASTPNVSGRCAPRVNVRPGADSPTESSEAVLCQPDTPTISRSPSVRLTVTAFVADVLFEATVPPD